jgi:hypothetical protein
MADAVRSFDGLERCAGLLQAGPLGMADEMDGTDWPIVSFQVQLPHVQRGLDQLARINVATWPDTHWVLRLSSARATAALRLRAVIRSLLRTPPGPSTLDGQLAADIRELADALRRLRLLIIRQYPEALRREGSAEYRRRCSCAGRGGLSHRQGAEDLRRDQID